MLIKCQHCGAPLDVDPNEQIVKCRFCKATTKVVEEPPRFVPAAAPQYPPQAPFQHRPAPGFGPPPVRQRPKGNKAGCVIAAAGAMVAVVAGVIAVFGAGMQAITSGTGIDLSGPEWWNAVSGTCFLDANGDGIFDVGGLTGEPGTGSIPTIVDGKTGSVIWMGEKKGKGAVSGCAGNDWLAVSRPDFGIEFHRARQPEVPVKFLARDKLQGLSLGKGCVNIKTADGTTTGVALPGGTAITCTAPEPRRLTEESLGVVGLTDDGTQLVVGARTYRIKKRETGTKMLTVEVSASGKTLWSKELPYASPTFNTGIGVGRGVVMVWAASPGKVDRAILVGLDESTGSQLYQKPQSGQVTNSIEQFQFNGRYLIVMYWGKLYAYEPKTGEIVWTVGG
jgi:outer membrane protein assembly factor BamB